MYYNSRSTLGEVGSETAQSAPVKKDMSAPAQEALATSTQASQSSTVATGSAQSNSTAEPGADAKAGEKINYVPVIALGGVIAVATVLYFIFN